MTLCLTIAVLLGSVGVSYALPECEGSPTTDYEVYGRWHKCVGAETGIYKGEWQFGQYHGCGTLYSLNDTHYGAFKEGKEDGWGKVTQKGHKLPRYSWWHKGANSGNISYVSKTQRIVSRRCQKLFQVTAQKVSPTTEAPSPSTGPSIKEAKKECADIGFKPKTEKFGECVLQFTE